jgi:Fe-S cluster biogenesis protein NfuA
VDSTQFQQRMQRVEELIAAIEAHANPVARASAVEMVRVLLDVHRAGLEQILEQVVRHGEPGQAIVNDLLESDLVSRLLLLHGLHPVDLNTRVMQALEQARPLLARQGASVELVEATHDVVRLSVAGGQGAHEMLERTILDLAPDVLRIEVVDADASASKLSLPLIRES